MEGPEQREWEQQEHRLSVGATRQGLGRSTLRRWQGCTTRLQERKQRSGLGTDPCMGNTDRH